MTRVLKYQFTVTAISNLHFVIKNPKALHKNSAKNTSQYLQSFETRDIKRKLLNIV